MHLEFIYRQRPDGNSPTSSAPYKLVRYRDSNFARDLEDRKSVMRYCFFLNDAVILWSSKKQRTILMLTTKAEYIVIGRIAREKVQIKRFINKLLLKIIRLCLKGNNKASLNFTKNPESQYQIKHINIYHYYIWKLVNNKEPDVEWISSAIMLANKMIKNLTIDLFKKHQVLLGLT